MSGLITDLSAIGAIDRSADLLEIVDLSANTSFKVTVNNLLGISGGSVLSTTDTQTVSNKTVDNSNTYTAKDGSLTLQNTADTTKQAVFSLSGNTTGTTRTYTLPNYNATMATLAGTETFTNKTLTSPVITGGTIDNSAVTVDTILGHTSSNVGTIYGVSFNSGTLTGLANNTISAANLATNAIKLGKGNITANITTSSTSNVQATGLTTSVTIPAGGRSVKITAMLPSISNTTSGQAIAVNLWSGTVGSGTQLQETIWFSTGNNVAIPVTLIAEHTPSAGAVTYNVGYRASANTATIAATSTAPAFILVEAI